MSIVKKKSALIMKINNTLY